MLIELDNAPPDANPLYWTDFVELRAMIHPDRRYSRGDLKAVMNRASSGQRRNNGPQSSNAQDSRWADIITFSKTRSSQFGNYYPFDISADGDTLFLQDNLNDSQEAYLGLLLCSSMRHIPKLRRNEVARYFEEVSFELFKTLLPQGSEIHPSWAGGGQQARYTGTHFNKLLNICKDIRSKSTFTAADFDATDTGDGGLDIVAWHPMGDQREGIPIAMAQSGCSKTDWKHKQLEAHFTAYTNMMSIMHPWSTFYFMPFDFRRADGDWAYKSDLSGAIIVDRLRLLNLGNQYSSLTNWPELQLLTEVKQLAIA